ncbi:MAG: hypothetical protein AAF456_16255 [Planctomycetota bacterium]
MSKRVLSVGQCDADNSSISGLLNENFKVEIVIAHHYEDAVQAARDEKFDLVMVNRLLDKDGSAGMNIVTTLLTDASTSQVPVMLVSNFQDAQREAVSAGAVEGFGKAALRDPETVARLAAYLSE